MVKTEVSFRDWRMKVCLCVNCKETVWWCGYHGCSMKEETLAIPIKKRSHDDVNQKFLVH